MAIVINKGLPGSKIEPHIADSGEFYRQMAALDFADDDIIQWKNGEPANRSMLQLQHDLGAWRVIHVSVPAVTHTGNTNETTVLTLDDVVPANAMGAKGLLKITPLVSASALDASVKTARLKINGTLVQTMLLTSLRTNDRQLLLRNKTVNSQVSPNPATSSSYGGSGAAISTYSFDTTAPLDVSMTFQNALAADSLTLEHIVIEVFHSD